MVDCSNVIITERYRGQNPWNMRWISSSFMLWVFISKETYGTSLALIHWMVKPFSHVNYEIIQEIHGKPKGRLWNYGETMIRQRYSRVKTLLAESQPPSWSGRYPVLPQKTPASGHFLVPEFDRFFWYSKCCFLFKATRAPFVFFRFELNLEI